MSVNNLTELFEHELQDVYFAEQKLLEALQEMADETENDDIKSALQDHRETTQGHIDRLEQVFEKLDSSPEREECEGIEGLIKEHDEFAGMDPAEGVHEVFDLTAAQKTEHYEIAAYGNLAMLADRIGMDDAGDLLHENLEEEEEFLDRLASLAENYDYDSVPAS